MKDRIDKAVDTLRGYCAKVTHCDDCRFISEDGNCLFMRKTAPCDRGRDKQQQEADK